MPVGSKTSKKIQPSGSPEDPTSKPTPLDVGLLAALPTLSLRARYMVESFMTGRHRSPLKGTSPEFAEYRAYQPGDDLRRIDWRLYGRSDRLQTKQFEDENQLRVELVLDVSSSMRYASRVGIFTKFDYARTVLAAIALLARRQHDAVGLAFVGAGRAADGGLIGFHRPGASVQHHHDIFNQLDTPPAAQGSAIVEGLRRLARLLSGGGLVVVASDFYADVAELESLLALFRSERLEMLGLQVLDPMEIEFGEAKSGQFVDLESGEVLPLNSRAARKGYLERFTAHRNKLMECFREYGADLLLMRTDEHPLDALSKYLAHRSCRTR
ncbi:MAG: DUF58 domain-containing protein [Nibricoccus sp.]